jgi:hypothetical protein
MAIPPMTPERAAMFFDCEGHVCERDQTICFTQNDPEMLLEVQAIWGGLLRTINKGGSCRLQLRRRESERFVAEVGPMCRKLS